MQPLAYFNEVTIVSGIWGQSRLWRHQPWGNVFSSNQNLHLHPKHCIGGLCLSPPSAM